MNTLLSSDMSHPAVRMLDLDLNLDVSVRLVDLRNWTDAWRMEDRQLQQQVEELNPKDRKTSCRERVLRLV